MSANEATSNSRKRERRGNTAEYTKITLILHILINVEEKTWSMCMEMVFYNQIGDPTIE